MDEIKKFYEVVQRGQIVGRFLDKKLAKKYAASFNSVIEGYVYNIEIKERDFLDSQVREEL